MFGLRFHNLLLELRRFVLFYLESERIAILIPQDNELRPSYLQAVPHGINLLLSLQSQRVVLKPRLVHCLSSIDPLALQPA
jgi:hypothetical protein